jgi:hypothetical protein
MASRQRSRSPNPKDRVTLALLGAMVLVVVASALTIWKLSTLNNTPTWWTQLDNNPNNTEQSGIELENRITTALTRMRPQGQEDWAAAINQDQLNSWLTHRLRDTVHSFSADESAHNTIDQLSDIRIKINTTGITIGARINHANGSTLVWAIINLNTDPQGRFAIEAQRIYIGSTRVPTALASKYLSSDNLGNASVDLGDGRLVRIKAIRPGNQRLEFALRTETKED